MVNWRGFAAPFAISGAVSVNLGIVIALWSIPFSLICIGVTLFIAAVVAGTE